MKRVLIFTPVVLVAGFVMMSGTGADQMTSTEYAIGRIGSEFGLMVSTMAGQFSSWISG